MKKKLLFIFLCSFLCFSLSGCYKFFEVNTDEISHYMSEESSNELVIFTETETTAETEPETEIITETEPETEEETFSSEIEWNTEYTSKEEVSLYLYTYHELPPNYISKNELKKLGWQGGDVWIYAQGKSIGGNKFYNNEKLLPDNSYFECDINYQGGKRNAERLIYTEDCEIIYYTDDHYQTFTQLY